MNAELQSIARRDKKIFLNNLRSLLMTVKDRVKKLA